MKKTLIVSIILLGLFVSSQAQAANWWSNFFGHKQASITMATSTKAWSGDCIVKAITARETAVVKSYGDMTAKISSALSVRATALEASWALADRGSRMTTRQATWKTFNDSVKAARGAYKTEVKAAWASYKVDAKNNCRTDVEGVEEEGGEINL